jgi:hypothetical protein
MSENPKTSLFIRGREYARAGQVPDRGCTAGLFKSAKTDERNSRATWNHGEHGTLLALLGTGRVAAA